MSAGVVPLEALEAGGQPGRTPSLTGGATRLAASQGFQLVARMLTSLILARFLTPRDFGLVGLANILTLLLQRTLGSGGTLNALVQKREVTVALASTVFWFNVAVGLVTTTVLLAGAPLISSALGDRGATGVLRGMAVTFAIGAAVRVPNAMLRRSMRYGRMALVGGVNAAVTAAVAIPMAWSGFGVESMVVAQIAALSVEVVLTWVFSGWRPTRTFRRHELRSVTRFARNFTLFNLVNYFADAGDKFIVGRFVGTGALGLYSLPYRLLFAPIIAIANVYRDLLFPVFSRHQDDNVAIATAYLRAVGAMALVTFPMCAITAALGGPLVDAGLGPAWHEAGPILSVMAVVALQQSVLVTGAIILTAKDRTDLLLKWGLVAGPTLMACYAVGAVWGAMGVAVGFLAGTTLLAYPAMALPFRELELPMWRLISALRPAMVASTGLTAAALAGRIATESMELSPVLVVGAGAAAGAALYVVCLLLIRPPALLDLRAMARRGA